MADAGRKETMNYRAPRRAGFWQGLSRLLRLRLAIPMMRSRHSAEYTARGTMIGLIWAFTPTVGLQMPLVFATWIVAKRLFRWDFSLLLGLAWTWVTNAFTLVPSYYLFYLTGQILLGHWQNLSGYDGFAEIWADAFQADLTVWQQIIAMSKILVLDWGAAMCLGSIPWAAIMGFVGYRYSLKFVHAHRHARAERMVKRGHKPHRHLLRGKHRPDSGTRRHHPVDEGSGSSL